jgi:hypothetical protein
MRMIMLVLAGGLALAGCQQEIEAPTTRGVCWQMVRPPHAPVKFNVVARDQPDLEHCAGELEKMRENFQALGAPQGVIVGAYQSQYLFLDRGTVFTSQTLEGMRFPFMVRTSDGRLVAVGGTPSEPSQ